VYREGEIPMKINKKRNWACLLKFGKNERGLTLIELLAVLVLFSMIIGIVASVLVGGMKQYYKINTEALIRDEADILMTQFMNHLYSAKKAETVSPSLIKITKTDGNVVQLGFDQTQKTATIDGNNILSSEFLQNNSQIIYDAADHSIKVILNIQHKNVPTASPIILESQVYLLKLP